MNKLANLLTMFFVFLCICLFLCFLDSTNKVHDLKSVKAKIDFTENLFVLELFETIFHIKIIRTNLLIYSIRIAKRKNYERQLINSQLNIKITWKILNEIMNKKNSKPKISDIFVCDNTVITDPLEIANKFCQYFANIGPKLAKKLPDTSKSPFEYINGNFPNSMPALSLVSENEIIDIVNDFKSGSAAGYTNLIAEPLTHIINPSL